MDSKNLHRIFYSALALIFFTVTTACSSKSGAPNIGGLIGPTVIGQMKTNLGVDLESAKGVMIAASGKSGAVSDDDKGINALYVIDEKDVPIEVEVTEGNAIVEPVNVYDFGPYVMLLYDRNSESRVEAKGTTCSVVLTRKSDAAMYCLDIKTNCTKYYCPNEYVQASKSGEVIYLRGDNLTRLDMRNPLEPTQVVILDLAQTEYVNNFLVNEAGDVMVSFWSSANNSNQLQIRNLSGRVTPVGINNTSSCFINGVGKDSDGFYYVNTTDSKVMHLTKGDNGKYTSSVYYDYSWGKANRIDLGSYWCYGSQNFARTEDRIFLRSGWSGDFIELVNPGGVPIKITLPSYSSIQAFAPFGDQLLLQGTDNWGRSSVLRFDPTSRKMSQAIDDENYLVYTIGFSPAGDATFSGLRLEDGARIVARLTSDGGIEVMSSKFPKATKIIRMK